MKSHLGFYMFKNIDSSTFVPKLPVCRKIATVAITQLFNLPKSPPMNIELRQQNKNPWTTSKTKVTRYSPIPKQEESKPWQP